MAIIKGVSGKCHELASGQTVAACQPDRKNIMIKVLGIFGPKGACKYGLKFSVEDIPFIMEALNEAVLVKIR